MRKRIETHHIRRAKGCALRPAYQRARERIHGVKADAETCSVMDRRQHRKYAHAIGDKIRRVFGADHAFAERSDQKLFKIIEYRRVGFLARDQFNQMHVARRIEEMHAAETMPQLRRKRLGECIDRQPRRITRKNGNRPQMRRDLFIQIGFPVHALGNRLDHDIAFFQ